MSDFLEEYLERASETIGERSPDEIAFDNEVLRQLRKGRSIRKALKIAGKKYPSEALDWNEENIDDIAAHYDYLKNHDEIIRRLGKPTD